MISCSQPFNVHKYEKGANRITLEEKDKSNAEEGTEKSHSNKKSKKPKTRLQSDKNTGNYIGKGK